MPSLRSMISELHRELLPALFDRDVPDETRATCGSCAMAPPGPPREVPEGSFRADVKCCSYHPSLPNFLVGAVLADEAPAMEEGRARVRARIASRIGVGPVWLAAPRKYTLLFLASRGSSFGRSLVLRCPYFSPEGSNCSIWRHRESVCTTYFCKHVAGADGEAFWRATEGYLRKVERRLAEHAARVVGPDLSAPALAPDALTLEELEDRAPDPTFHASVWREWAGREEAFYRACRDVVASLDRASFSRVVSDTETDASLAAAEEALSRALSPVLPDRLALRPGISAAVSEETVLVSTYSSNQPAVLDAALFRALEAFRGGSSVREVNERLSRDEGAEIPYAVLLELYRLRVLVPADG
jgi:Fe-S-cluster containining protein